MGQNNFAIKSLYCEINDVDIFNPLLQAGASFKAWKVLYQETYITGVINANVKQFYKSLQRLTVKCRPWQKHT